jgi:hypothetical protein
MFEATATQTAWRLDVYVTLAQINITSSVDLVGYDVDLIRLSV